MYYDAVGEMEMGCNCADLIYCDGASFSGFREKPWPVPPGQWGRLKPNNISELNFRGILNLDGVVDHLWRSSGLDQATELVVTGGSAGGLSVRTNWILFWFGECLNGLSLLPHTDFPSRG